MKVRIHDPTAVPIPVYPGPEATVSPRTLIQTFGRLHKRALGTACGLVLGSSIFLLTAISLVVPGIPSWHLALLDNFLPGYTVSWGGAFNGLFWGGFAGFTFGWFAAFCRNFVIALWLVLLTARAQFSQTQDFLDHI